MLHLVAEKALNQILSSMKATLSLYCFTKSLNIIKLQAIYWSHSFDRPCSTIYLTGYHPHCGNHFLVFHCTWKNHLKAKQSIEERDQLGHRSWKDNDYAQSHCSPKHFSQTKENSIFFHIPCGIGENKNIPSHVERKSEYNQRMRFQQLVHSALERNRSNGCHFHNILEELGETIIWQWNECYVPAWNVEIEKIRVVWWLDMTKKNMEN